MTDGVSDGLVGGAAGVVGMDEGLIVLRVDGSIRAFDPVAERLLGLAPGGLRVGARLSESVGASVERRFLALLPAGGNAGELFTARLGSPQSGDAIEMFATVVAGELEVEQMILVRLRRTAGDGRPAGRELAARLSRELRDPVAAIRGCSQTLLSGALDEAERARRFVEMMDHHADQLEEMADDLGAWAQILPEWVRDHSRPVDVVPALGGAARHHSAAILRKGVSVRAVPPSANVVVAAVPELFERSLNGVVGEVVRASTRGEEVTCAAAPMADPGDRGTALAEIEITRGRRAAASTCRPAVNEVEGRVSLRLETIDEMVRVHGGWLSAERSAGRLDGVRLYWPVWSADPT